MTSGTLVSLDYTVKFSNGEATEEFVFHFEDGKPMLLTYQVTSQLLITK